MKKTMTIIFCTIFLFGIAGIGIAKDGINSKEKTINIAGLDVLTGKYGDYGTADKWGQEIAVKEINANGGIQKGPLKGYTLKLDFYDEKGDPKEAASVARKVSNGDYLVVTGPTFSSSALAASPVFFRSGIANIITYANADTITQQGFDNLIRLTHTTNSITREMAKTVKEKYGKSKVAIINDNLDYGQQLLGRFKEHVNDYNIEITSQSTVTPGQDVDFKSVLVKARTTNPDVLLLFCAYTEGGFIVRQARNMGWDVKIFAVDGVLNPKFKELAGDLKNVDILIVPSIDPTRPEAKHLAKTYKEKHKTLPPLSAIYGYDAINIIKVIVESGGIDRKSFIQQLKTISVPGIASPRYEFDDAGEGKTPLFETVSAIDHFAKGE